MALTISIDGFGVVANADATTNDTAQNGTGDWTELGGGTISFNPDVYLFEGGTAVGSIGNKYASKTGNSIYTSPTALNFGTGGNADGDLLYLTVNIQSIGQFDTLANWGFALEVGADVSIVRTSNNMYMWRVAGEDDGNGWTGGWKTFALAIGNTGETVGSPSTSTCDTFGVWIDTNVSVRADSIFITQIISGKGIECTGTPTTTGEGFNELIDWCTDYTNRLVPVLERRGNTIYQKGGITVGDGSTSTTLSAYGNSIECEETSYWNGTSWVTTMNSDSNYIVTLANAAVDFRNLTYTGYIDNKLQWDTSLGNASSVSGGALKVVGSWSVKSSDTFSGVVFQDNDALSLGTASYDDCTFVSCGSQTIGTTTSFTGNTFRPASGTTALITSTLNDLSDGIFISGGAGHAVELTSVTDSPMTWNSTTSGYSGTSTDATIYITASSSADLTINVTGGTTPTIRKAAGYTGTVTVSASVPVEVTVTKADGTPIQGAAVYLKTVGGTVVLNGLTNSSGVISGSYGGTTPTSIDTNVSGVKHASGSIAYEYFTLGGSITSSGYSQTALLSED